MDHGTAERLIQSHKALIVAMGMHWANEERKLNGEANAYDDGDFYNLTVDLY